MLTYKHKFDRKDEEMGTVGRNAPCPCGSGKKYKKCCGKQKVVSLDQLMNQDMLELQQHVLSFALFDYEPHLNHFLENELSASQMAEEFEEIYLFHLTNWFIFHMEVEEGQTIVDKYIELHSNRMSRPIIKESLERWGESPSIIGRVDEVHEDQVIVSDLLTHEQTTIKCLEELPELNSVILAQIVPYGQTFTFFTTYISLDEEVEGFQEEIESMYEHSDKLSPDDFVQNDYPVILAWVFVENMDDLDEIIEAFEWDDPSYEKVATAFADSMVQEDYPTEMIYTGKILWHKYCTKEKPSINQTGRYAAALEYLISKDLDLFTGKTQKALATQYGVSAKSISTAYHHMKTILGDDLEEFSMALEADADVEGLFEEDSIPQEWIDEVEKEALSRNFSSEEEVEAFVEEQLLAKMSDLFGTPGMFDQLGDKMLPGQGSTKRVPSNKEQIYQLKITLKGLRPPIWRRVQVHSDISFAELHDVIQVLMNWTDTHLHNFEVLGRDKGLGERVFIGPKQEESFGSSFLMEELDEEEEQLSYWLVNEKDSVLYKYDFGDNWEHKIILEKILEPEESIDYPRCTAARREPPTEDSRWEVIEETDNHGKWQPNPDPSPKQLQQELNERLESRGRFL